MNRTNIYLDDDQIQALKLLATQDRCSTSEVVRKAVDSYLAVRLAKDGPWKQRLVDFMERIQSRIPSVDSTEELTTEIAQAVQEVRKSAASRR
ncbi:MAG: hypothetical protein EXR51_01370 [Dehalococcoidia bacterium]|nr:hypothetical protein [Dehalococcoidia bacterium]